MSFTGSVELTVSAIEIPKLLVQPIFQHLQTNASRRWHTKKFVVIGLFHIFSDASCPDAYPVHHMSSALLAATHLMMGEHIAARLSSKACGSKACLLPLQVSQLPLRSWQKFDDARVATTLFSSVWQVGLSTATQLAIMLDLRALNFHSSYWPLEPTVLGLACTIPLQR